MDWKRRAPLLLLAAAGGSLFFSPVTALQFENDGRGAVTRYSVRPGDSFSVTSIHSIYREPVTEEFSVGRGGELVLTGVRSASGAVMEYFGFDDSRPFHAMDRPMRAIVFRVAAGDAQVLTLGDRRISFLSLGDHGDRITVRMVSACIAARMIGWAAGRVLPR